MAENKRRRRKAIHKLDQGAIRMLKKFQKKHECDLEPDVKKEPCASCPDSKKCSHFGRERHHVKRYQTT